MDDHDEILRSFRVLLDSIAVMVKTLEDDIRGLDEFSIDMPTWEQVHNQKLLYTCMYEVDSKIDPINRRVVSIQVMRASLKKLRLNTKKFDFREKQALNSRIQSILEIIEDLEVALKAHKENLDRKSRLLNTAHFMLTHERQSL